MMVVAGLLAGFIIFGAKIFGNAGLSVYEIMIGTSLIATIGLAPLVIFKKSWRMPVGFLKYIPFFGFIGFIISFSQYGAVNLGVPVSISVLLLYTMPLWVIIFDKVFLKEIITKEKIFAVITVLIGVLLLINPFTETDFGSIPGVILALLGGVALAFWVILGRVVGRKLYHPVAIRFGYSISTLFFLVVSYPIVKNYVNMPEFMSLSFSFPIIIWVYLTLYVFITNVAGNLLFYKAVQKISATDAGVILLIEPLSGTLLAAVFLSQPVTWLIGLGGILILTGNYLVVK